MCSAQSDAEGHAETEPRLRADDNDASAGTGDDLTARARIRNAALALFGRHGVAKTSVRAIAESAGVSPALVIHHFGSKDGLREACDTYVVEDLIAKNRELSGADLNGVMRQWLAEPERFRAAFDYLVRLILDGEEPGLALFAELVAGTEAILAKGESAGTVRRVDDPRTRAILVAAFGMMPLLLERHFGQLLQTDGLDAAALAKITVPSLDLLTNGLYTDDTYLTAAEAATREETT